MKKKKVGKRKKKKDEKTEDEIKPSKHENVGNLNCYSEEVAREIINKIISLTFTSINMKKMNKIIDDYYVMNLLNTINSTLEIYYMNHDMDIYFPLNTDIKNKSLIEEPKKEKIRKKIEEKKIYNKNKKNEKDELIIERTYKDEIDTENINTHTPLYNAEILNKNFWGTIPEPQSFSFERTCTYKNVIKEGNKYNIKKEISIPSLENSKRKKFIKLKTKYSSFIGRKILDIYNIKRKTFIKPSDDLPSERISDEILGIIPEDDDIKIMRKQLLEEINMKNIEERKERERKKMEEIASRNKGKKNSKDENENGLNPDLFIKEFIPISSNQKEIKGGSTKEIIEEEKKQLTKKARKNIEYNIIPKVKTEKELIKEGQKLFLKKYILNQNDFNLEFDDDEPKGNIRPSGSNFGIIKPEIGVIIQENAKVKSGGVNFLEKFNKFSVNDFNRTMNVIFEKNISNINNNYDTNVYSTSKNFMINNNYLNNTTTLFNNKTTTSFGEKKKGESSDKELNEKKLFRKTFINKLTNLKKKYIYKSKSEINMSNNININLFREVLSDNNNYYNSYNVYDTNKSNNNVELSHIAKNKLFHKNYFSPIPTNILNTYKNSLLKDYFYNTGNNLTYRKIKRDKYNIIDAFNKNLVDGNNKFNELLYKKMMENTNNDFLPKIKKSNSIMTYKGIRTKNYFFRTRKKENHK